MVKFEGKLRFLEVDEKNINDVYEILHIVLNFQKITMYRFLLLRVKAVKVSSLLFVYFSTVATSLCSAVCH